MTFEEARATKSAREDRVAITSAAMDMFPRDAMGLTPDAVKFSPEFRQSKAEFNHAFEELRIFNSFILRVFAKECCEERRKRRAG